MDFDALIKVESGLGTAAVIVMNKQVFYYFATKLIQVWKRIL
jgi:NADH:ubiquinone oxidoreductase subunit F (NADH-binding)